MSAPLPAASVRDAARHQADLVRGSWLLRLTQGQATATEVITAAAGPGGAPLMRLRLRSLLMAQPGWGEDRSEHLVSQVIRVSGAQLRPGFQATVAWLLDRRAGGRRFAAWLDALQVKDGLPCAGFPFRLEGTH